VPAASVGKLMAGWAPRGQLGIDLQIAVRALAPPLIQNVKVRETAGILRAGAKRQRHSSHW